MCDCLLWHPVWKAAAKLARCQPDTVFAVFAALDGEGDSAHRLRPEILAAGLARRAQVIERILASLASLGVTCDGVVTPQWRQGSDTAARDGLSMKPSAIRMRQKRLRDATISGGAQTPISGPVTSVTCDATFLEEDQEQDHLYPPLAREVDLSTELPPAGTFAENSKKARADRWCFNTLEEARRILPDARWHKLNEAAWAEPRPRWAQIELDRISARVKARKGQGPPDRRQTEMLYPMSARRMGPATDNHGYRGERKSA